NGTLTIAFGTYNGDGTFTANAEKAAKTITIDPAKSTLADIRDTINDANAGITASIVNDGSGNRLVIASKDSGLANALKITVDDADGNHTDNAGLSKLAFDASTGGVTNMTETVAAKNAVMVIDGITVQKSSNTIDDALEGVTLNLLKAEPGTTSTLTVEKDNSSVEAAVKAFVTAYNGLEKTITNLSRYDSTTDQASILTGDSTVRMVQFRVRAMLSDNQLTAGGINSLSELGISFQKDGTLALDSTKLSAVLADPEKSVSEFFGDIPGDTTSTPGFISRLDQLIEGMTRSDGLIESRIDGIDSVIKTIDKRTESLEYRLEEIEKNLRTQYTALDTMIASMTQTSNYLQQQLASLNI
ncbi:MAG: flagellar filament capping protein FliD, partial [Nitrosomonas sp.]|nr:flagellar filament capping protein FliD [Nitrosomonas sp.]